MNSKKLIKFANIFLSLATKEKIPKNTTDFKLFIKNLESLDTFGARKKYAAANLKKISSGSSRIVYLTPHKTVLKLAKNEKGLAQNKEETNPKMKSKYLNKVLDKSSKNLWIEVPHLEKITEKKFKELTDISFNNFESSIRYGLKSVSENPDKEKPDCFDEVSKTNIYKEIVSLGKEFKLMPGDLAKISSWGIKDNKPVLIDAGLTLDVFKTFYET